ncbi:MAG: DNA polymerase/3'-5' exonuclease PolX [Firmicutes bacterium]|nr:DNA polymerase/3'-5' exonuclease PolX [Bacillota bacterium]
MSQQNVINFLKDIALLMELAGENVFKTRAFQNGARAIQGLEEDQFEQLVQEDKLREIPGIGAGLEEAILGVLSTGTAQVYEKLQEKIPLSLLDLFKIPGLGAKRIRKLYQALQITSLGELEYACAENRLLQLPGFGKKSQASILKEIALLKSYQDSYLYSQAKPLAQDLLAELKHFYPKAAFQLAGALRRRLEVVDKIEILCTGLTAQDFLKSKDHPLADPILKGSSIRAQTKESFPAVIHFSSKERKGTALIYSTGSKAHLRHLEKKSPLPAAPGEEEVYQKMNLPFIPPELREGCFEFDLQEDFSSLVTLEDIQGVFHNHSNYSDGINTLEEIALHGKKLGYTYIGLADHSQSAFYARGLKPADLLRQMEEIDAVNQEYEGITLLKGLEADILPDGSLDCKDELLAQLDYSVASVHSSFKMTKEEMTKRIIKALANPYVNILGHPTGRLLLAREPYALDLEEIIEACRRYGVVLEINANPQRLDLDWRWARRAWDKGVFLAINPDAHRLSGYDFTKYGVYTARKAGLPKEAILNTRSLKEVKRILKSLKEGNRK